MNRQFVRTDAPATPLFIVGMNGSGTTMMLDCLARHPTLYGFPTETRLIPYLIEQAKGLGDLSSDEHFLRLWNSVLAVPLFTEVNDNQPMARPEDWREYPRSLAAVLDAVYRYFGSEFGKSRWCEKSPQNVQNIEALAGLFPHARFLHMVRDGRDCAASLHRRWKRTPELIVYRWKKLVTTGRNAGDSIGERYLEIRYEDITGEPELYMRRICEFAGVPFDCAVLDSSGPWLESAGDAKGLVKTEPRWVRSFSPAARQRMERIAGQTITQFGYTDVMVSGDRDPSRLQLIYWRCTDYLRQYTNEVRRKFAGESEKSWALIARLPWVAMRELKHKKY